MCPPIPFFPTSGATQTFNGGRGGGACTSDHHASHPRPDITVLFDHTTKHPLSSSFDGGSGESFITRSRRLPPQLPPRRGAQKQPTPGAGTPNTCPRQRKSLRGCPTRRLRP